MVDAVKRVRIFATEFEVNRLDKAQFVASATAWVKGMQSQSIFETGATQDLDQDQPELIGSKGDRLSFRDFSDASGQTSALGLRHEVPDIDGCIWRTEAVQLTKAGQNGVLRGTAVDRVVSAPAIDRDRQATRKDKQTWPSRSKRTWALPSCVQNEDGLADA